MTDAKQFSGSAPGNRRGADRASVSLADGLAGRNNAFGVIRLVLACLVIVSHAFPTGGWGEDPLPAHSRGQENIGGVAVLGFFAISGYLIAKSGINSDGLQFIWRRFLRIFPAFWVVLLVAAIGVGPIAWVASGHSLGTYFTLSEGGPFRYLWLNAGLAMRQWGVYDIFASTTPYGLSGAGAVFNGSLWSLNYEWGAYLIIWVLVLAGVFTRARPLIIVVTGFYLIAQIGTLYAPEAIARVFPYLGDGLRVSLPLLFLYGACFAVYARRIPLDGRLAALAAMITVFTLWKGGLSILGYPALAYLVLWLAASLPKSLNWIGSKNDYSYGIYLYGFLVQQFTAALGWYTWGYVPWVIACLLLSAGFAWLSWHGIEKRALQLKDWGPGRGFAYWWNRVAVMRRGPQPGALE
jgi:peptidoglycan/LPS O-acetylase OafA/YrhL